jgi:hypothetical protein
MSLSERIAPQLLIIAVVMPAVGARHAGMAGRFRGGQLAQAEGAAGAEGVGSCTRARAARRAATSADWRTELPLKRALECVSKQRTPEERIVSTQGFSDRPGYASSS